MMAMLRRAWNDSVWSKVIAAGITAALAAIGGFAMKPLERAGTQLADALAASVVVPVWLVCGGLALLAVQIAAVVLLCRERTTRAQDADPQPNAVPVALISSNRWHGPRPGQN